MNRMVKILEPLSASSRERVLAWVTGHSKDMPEPGPVPRDPRQLEIPGAFPETVVARQAIVDPSFFGSAE